MYIGVKLLYKHDRTPHRSLKKRFPAPSLNDSGERSVSKIRQDNMAFWMNAMFLEVLQEVLSGLLIMEPNMEGRKRIRGRRPRTLKRILILCGFTCFRCQIAVYLRERERERTQRIEKKRNNICVKNA